MKLFLSILLIGTAVAVQILGAGRADSDCYDISWDCIKMKNLCNDTNYQKIMEGQCPETCGYCVVPTAPNGVCTDNPAYDCIGFAAYCNDPVRKDELRLNCPVLCHSCPTHAPGSCFDTNINCQLWAARGFCTDPRNNPAEVKEMCAETCGLC